jgi:hypothetical protein
MCFHRERECFGHYSVKEPNRPLLADVLETELEKVDQCLLTRVTTSVSRSYRHESDQLRELDAKRGQYYQSLIGVLR